MFDSTIGRWQSKDPKSFDAGDTNLYRFVGNHPSYATDPSGESILGQAIRQTLRTARKDAVKNYAKEQLRNSFYSYIKKYLKADGLNDLTQIHHLIAQQFFESTKYPGISNFLEEVGILRDASRNTTVLPTRKALESGIDIGNASLHDGGHLASYFDFVREKLLEQKDVYEGAVSRATTDAARGEARKSAREAIELIQSELRIKLQCGDIKLHHFDTPELRQQYLATMMLLHVASGQSVEAAENSTMEWLEREIENESYYRQKNAIVKFGTAKYYARDSNSSAARWSAWAADSFNPVEDVVVVTDLMQEAPAGIARLIEGGAIVVQEAYSAPGSIKEQESAIRGSGMFEWMESFWKPFDVMRGEW